MSHFAKCLGGTLLTDDIEGNMPAELCLVSVESDSGLSEKVGRLAYRRRMLPHTVYTESGKPDGDSTQQRLSLNVSW